MAILRRQTARTTNPATDPDAVLVIWAQQNPQAFTALYDRYVAGVYGYCLSQLGDPDAAEDATSQTFLKALAALPSYREAGRFRSWLFAIAHNVVTDTYRRKGAGASIEEAIDIVDPAPPPEQIALLADERRLLSTALTLLPAEQRQVIELRLSGLLSVEVATILGRSPEAVRALQLRATRRLQALLTIPGAANEVRHV